MTPTTAPRRTHLVALLLTPLLLVAAGCSGDDESPKTPGQALAQAKRALDDTSGVTLELTTKSLPKGVDGVLEAQGVGTHAPAFDGELKVSVNSLVVDVPVVAVDGKVFAKLPFTSEFKEIDPGDYGAPDPATLMDPQEGLSSWLTATEDVEKGDQVRDGDKVLTSYSGMLPGQAVATVIPSADTGADFTATYTVDSAGRLAGAQIKGPFYGPKGVVDYRFTVSGYGTEKDITEP